MRDWLLKPYVLYPSRRKFLRRLAASYALLVTPATAYVVFAPFGLATLWIGGTAFFHFTGLAACLHLLVLGMPPAEGMEETNKSDELSFWAEIRVRSWSKKFWLPGDERRLVMAIIMLPYSLVYLIVGGAATGIYSWFV